MQPLPPPPRGQLHPARAPRGALPHAGHFPLRRRRAHLRAGWGRPDGNYRCPEPPPEGGRRRLSPPGPQPRPWGSAPPPEGAPGGPHLPAENAAPGTRGWAPRERTRSPKPEASTPPARRVRGAPAAPRGTQVLPATLRGPPAAGTPTRAPSSGRRGDSHPLPAPGSRVPLGRRPTRGTRPRAALRPRGPRPRAIASRPGPARVPCPGAPGTVPAARGPGPHLPRARCPSSWCRGREGARRAAGAAPRSPSPAIPSPLELPAVEESPGPRRRRLLRLTAPRRVPSAAPPPGRSSAKWPEEAAAPAAAAPARE